MRKLIVSFLLLAAVISCREPLFDPQPRWMHEQGRSARDERQEQTGPDGGPEVSRERLPDAYLTAFHFAEGVPWRDSVTTGAEIVLYKNGAEHLRVPVHGTPEADRHRVVAGSLWTDACEDGRMVVSCNGVERFRYEGDELYRGFLVREGQVHTLGQRPGQEGFCYRIDGEEVYSSTLGTILGAPGDPEWPDGAFSADSTGVYYAYALPIRRGGGDLEWEYRVMRGAEQVLTLRPGDVYRLYDIRVYKGKVYYCEQTDARPSSLSVIRDATVESVGVPASETPHAPRLVPVDDRLVVKGHSTVNEPGRSIYWYRAKGQSLFLAMEDLPFLDCYRDPEGRVAAVLLREGAEQLVAAVTLDRKKKEMPPGRYRMTTSRCAAWGNGDFAIALTHADGLEHRVMQVSRDSVHIDTYSFNGCFTSLQYQ